MTTGERIKQLRKENGYTQTQLGKKCGVSHSAVSQWENGDTKSLKSETLIAASIALNVSPTYLLNGKRKNEPALLPQNQQLIELFNDLPKKEQQSFMQQLIKAHEYNSLRQENQILKEERAKYTRKDK